MSKLIVRSVHINTEQKTEEMKKPNLTLIEEIRDPKPLEIGACWCPGIGQAVVMVTKFPIALGKC